MGHWRTFWRAGPVSASALKAAEICAAARQSRPMCPELFDHFIGLDVSTRQTALDGIEARIGFREHARGSFARGGVFFKRQ